MPERVPVLAVRNGGQDFLEVPTARENLVAALRRERQGYVVRGLADRVAQVDAQLASLGVRGTPVTETRSTQSTRGMNEDDGQERERARRRHRQRPGGEAAAGNG